MSDVTIQLELSVPEEIQNHPKVKQWVKQKEIQLDATLNAMMQYYGKHGHMLVPVPFERSLI